MTLPSPKPKARRLQSIEREIRLLRLKLPEQLRLMRDLAVLAAANRRLIAEIEVYGRREKTLRERLAKHGEAL